MKWPARQRVKTLLIVLISLVVFVAFLARVNRRRGGGPLLTWSRSETIKPLPFASTEVNSNAAATPSTQSSETSSPAAAPNPTPLISPAGLIIPVAGVRANQLIDTFSEARSEGRVHDAIDIPAPRGTPVLSATGGRVLKLFDSKAGGKMVYAADSSERFILMYAHLDSYANGLAEGQPLTRGQVLGAVGTTGNAPPNLPHLHFAIARSNDVKVWWKGMPVNPYPMLVR